MQKNLFYIKNKLYLCSVKTKYVEHTYKILTISSLIKFLTKIDLS